MCVDGTLEKVKHMQKLKDCKSYVVGPYSVKCKFSKHFLILLFLPLYHDISFPDTPVLGEVELCYK